MSADNHDDDLAPESTEGFKVGEQKTIDEYQKLGKSRQRLTPAQSDFWISDKTFGPSAFLIDDLLNPASGTD